VGDVQQTSDIGVHHGLPVFQRYLRRRRGAKRKAGIVDENIDVPETLRQSG